MSSRLLLILTLRCRESERLMSEARERDLSRSERLALRMHMVVCRSCRTARQQFHRLGDELQRLGDEESMGETPMSAAARARIDRALLDARESH